MHGAKFLYAVSPSGLNAENFRKHRRYGILTRSAFLRLSDLSAQSRITAGRDSHPAPKLFNFYD